MTMIKAFTDLEQSRKLAEILPIESADMWWSRCTITDFGDAVLKVSYAVEPCNISQFRNTKEDIPCWSLAALLGVLPVLGNKHAVFGTSIKESKWHVLYHNIDTLFLEDSGLYDNLIDACYKLILKLKEKNLL